MRITLASLIICFCFCHSFSQTKVQKTESGWELIVDGKPYEVKGATFGYDDYTEKYDDYFKDLKSIGVNTIRTWATGKNTPKLLDTAEKYGIKVMLGIWMRHGRAGMEADDSFDYINDKEGKKEQYRNAIEVVETYKDHPAVLTWGVGNEVYLNMSTDEEKKVYSKLLENICTYIKMIDPNHPITSVEAWTFGMDWWSKYVPSIDIYGLNSYGAGVNFLQHEMQKRNIDKPYIITEYGVTGEWDIKEKIHDVKIEPNDTEKYDAIARGISNNITNKPNNLGVFVFHYSDGLNHMSSWLNTHHNGKMRLQYWAIKEAYTGEKPINIVPKIKTFSLTKEPVESDTWIPVSLEVSDKENDNLEFEFYYNQRTGTRVRRDQINKLKHKGSYKDGFEIKVPNEYGGIKVYVNVIDSYPNVGIATTSIFINDEKAKSRKFLTAKTTLPFYVYKDGLKMPYSPTAYMGNHKAMTVEVQDTTEVYSGKHALKISYNVNNDWYGLGLVDPPNDWGEMLGGYDISGATTFSFWAKSNKDNVSATIGFGLIGKEKTYYDSAKTSIKINLSKEWSYHVIDIKDLDLTAIRSGLTLFSSPEDGQPQDIFLDDVKFE